MVRARKNSVRFWTAPVFWRFGDRQRNGDQNQRSGFRASEWHLARTPALHGVSPPRPLLKRALTRTFRPYLIRR